MLLRNSFHELERITHASLLEPTAESNNFFMKLHDNSLFHKDDTCER